MKIIRADDLRLPESLQFYKTNGIMFAGAPMTEEVMNILLIDDDARYVDVIRHHLHAFQDRRFNVHWYSDPEKGIKALGSLPAVDLVLMDYFLPGTNGVEVAKRIRSEGRGVPIIVLSSNKDFRIAVEAIKEGVDDYLLKEEMVDTLLQRTIIAVLERTRLKRCIAEAEKKHLMSEKKMETVQELIVTMCHEFNNPLAAIKISADILQRQQLPADQRDLLARLNGNIALLEKQIAKLRDLNSVKPG